MCFQCCHRHINDNTGNYCHGHSNEEKQYNDDEVLVDLALSGKAKKKPKFYHYEEKLQDKGQTCVIWCLKDFCQNKKWSGDVFQKEKLDRERKLRELKRNSRVSSSSSSSSSSSAMANSNKINVKDLEENNNNDAIKRKMSGNIIIIIVIIIINIIITIIISKEAGFKKERNQMVRVEDKVGSSD